MSIPERLDEISLPVPRRARIQRAVCAALLPVVAAPLAFTVAHGPGERTEVDALRSTAAAVTRSAPGAAAAAPVVITTTTAAPTTTTPPPPTVAPATPPPPPPATAASSTTDASTTTEADHARALAAAGPTTTAPDPASPTTAPPAPPTTRPAPPTTTPTPPTRIDSGQATWYRWKPGNCAHNTLPKGTVVTVIAVASGRSATCVVGDRGAFQRPTIIDLDATVFEQIAPLGAGRISVIISW